MFFFNLSHKFRLECVDVILVPRLVYWQCKGLVTMHDLHTGGLFHILSAKTVVKCCSLTRIRAVGHVDSRVVAIQTKLVLFFQFSN
jgi:hypothetical protein